MSLFLVVAFIENLLLQYINSMSERLKFGCSSGGCWCGNTDMHNISRRN